MVFGAPAGRDQYRERNIRTQRARIIQAKHERNAARKAGDHAMADALQLQIDGWQGTLRELGA